MTGNDVEQITQYCVDDRDRPSPLTGFELNCLERHNHYRQLHNVEPIKIDPELSHQAQNWADYLLEKKCLKHREDNPFGENLFVLSGNYDSVSDGAEVAAVDSWYDEYHSYFSNPDLNNIREYY